MKNVEDHQKSWQILDGDDTLNQNQMAAMLNVTQQTISDRLKAMGENPKVWKMGAI